MSGVTTPPTPWLLGYRLFGLRLPEEYRVWVAHDVRTKAYVPWRTARTLLAGACLIGLYSLAQHQVYDWPSRKTLIRLGAAVLAYSLLASGKALVRRELRWQRIDRHGRPATPHRHAVLDNAEAAVAVALAAVLWCGGAAAISYSVRPAGLAALKCRKPSAAVFDRIKAGKTRADATFVDIKGVSFSGGQAVAAAMRAPSTDPKRKYDSQLDMWIIQGNTVYLYGEDVTNPSWTRFPAPKAVDRVAGEALNRAVTCVAFALRP
jgi:hypothetical protein